jgi:serine phosphatase RsbU (regulator of sigma subunit)
VIAAGVRAALRVTSRFNTLTESLRRTASSMQGDFNDSGTFATMFTARLRPSHGHIEYVDAGHGLAIIVPAAGETRLLPSRDLPLGADLEGTWQSHETRLEPGETLIVVSDGLLDIFPDPLEAMRAARTLAASGRTSEEMADRIIEAGAGHPLADDLTALVVRRDE